MTAAEVLGIWIASIAIIIAATLTIIGLVVSIAIWFHGLIRDLERLTGKHGERITRVEATLDKTPPGHRADEDEPKRPADGD